MYNALIRLDYIIIFGLIGMFSLVLVLGFASEHAKQKDVQDLEPCAYVVLDRQSHPIRPIYPNSDGTCPEIVEMKK